MEQDFEEFDEMEPKKKREIARELSRDKISKFEMDDLFLE